MSLERCRGLKKVKLRKDAKDKKIFKLGTTHFYKVSLVAKERGFPCKEAKHSSEKGRKRNL